MLSTRALRNERVCCPVSHVPESVVHPGGLPGTGTAEVELISTVLRDNLLAPDLDVSLALSSSHSTTGGVGDSFSAVFQHKKPQGNKFPISVACFPLPLCEIAPMEQSAIHHREEKGRS